MLINLNKELNKLAKNVIIHLPVVGEDLAHWAVSNDKGLLTSEQSTGTLSEAAAFVDGRRAMLIVPGDDVLLAEAKVPGGSAARAQQAVPYALEDQLADDVDQLHFALGSKGKDDSYPVAVVGRQTMDTVKEQCANADLRVSEIVPETLALPKFSGTDVGESAWTALLDKQQAVVRLNGYTGFATDASMAGIMLDGARKDLPDDINASMVVFRTDPGVSIPEFGNIEMEARECDSRLSLYASGLASAPRINLQQGEYNPKTQLNRNWKPWRWTAVLAAMLGVIFLGGKLMEQQQLKHQVVNLESQITAAFKTAMPGVKMQRPVRQVKAQINKLSGGAPEGFINSLHHITGALAEQPQTVVRSINFRSGRFELDINTDAIPSLDLLTAELKKRGNLSMTTQSANREGDGLRSRIRIE
ncbi:MAG: type II secretion system protein GspL [Granulosicoccaceae bacterium]